MAAVASSSSSSSAAGPSHISDQLTSASSTAPSSASAEVFKRLHPSQYLSRFLGKGYRPDGRKVGGWRDVSINVGSISTAHGSSLVRMGDTTIVCGIKAEIAEPTAQSPNEGFVVPNIDLPALCSPNFKPGPPGDEAQTYSNWLNDLLVSSRTIPPESLLISSAKAAWVIYIDVVCINYDGNAFDAAVLAVMAALKNTRLPTARYDEETGRTICSRTETHPLTLGRIPLSCSFGIFESTHLLPDPTAYETPLLPTTITVALDSEDVGVTCLIRQEGLGGTVGKSGERVLGEAWNAAEARVRELRAVLDESVDA
ncbi:exosome complex component RRP43 [Kwoniella heveanensis BCC8398]|uniref:Ribosomal RNA-processing protein 43 n=1 Tax=Kwoniella heveanensis BCC8398 TaxID=1296120 RepID=A0A1B9GTR1_9TREE|nr:exosome complex component RRP43 [Kwoniella heveanensis BCC8398]